MIVLASLAVLVAVVVGVGVLGFNKLRRADVAAAEAIGGIDVQLTRRADLVPNLVETVKGYAAHERGVLEEVTRARARVARAAAADSVPEKAAADAELAGALVHLNAVVEAYPDLEASSSFAELQRQLAEAEDQIAFARQYYNDAAATVNTLTRTVPWMFLAGVADVSTREFYDAPAAHAQPPQVSF